VKIVKEIHQGTQLYSNLIVSLALPALSLSLYTLEFDPISLLLMCFLFFFLEKGECMR